MNSRKTRLPEIIDILTHQVISSQEDLSKQLAVRGHITTQATLSRDLKLLKATKISDERGGYRYVVGEPPLSTRNRTRHRSLPIPSNHSAVLSIAITGNLAVIKTRNGYASGLAYEIDLLQFGILAALNIYVMLESPLVLGTIPGADTVFVALREGSPRKEAFNLFSTFIPMSVMSTAAPMFIDE